MRPKSTWAPSRIKMNKRMMNAVVVTYSSSFFASPAFIFEAEKVFVSEHGAEDKNRHEAAGLQAFGGKIGADDGHQRHHRCIFCEECPSFMRDKQRGQVSERSAGDNAVDRLLE